MSNIDLHHVGLDLTAYNVSGVGFKIIAEIFSCTNFIPL